MDLYFDPHVHIYPNYDLHTFFPALVDNFKNAASSKRTEDLFAVCLTERPECNYYQSLKNGCSYPVQLMQGYYQIAIKGTPLLVFPGKQVSTLEGLEVLALFMEQTLPERTPLQGLLSYISENKGLAVINWAPGKWSGERGSLLKSLYPDLPQDVLLGYTKLLPLGLSYPSLIQADLEKGKNVLFGSDPLPISGEYSEAGSCGIILKDIGEVRPQQIKSQLISNTISTFGRRGSLLRVAHRLLKNEFKRRNF